MHLADRRWKWRDRRKGLVRAPEEASLENWHRQNQNWLFVVFLVCRWVVASTHENPWIFVHSLRSRFSRLKSFCSTPRPGPKSNNQVVPWKKRVVVPQLTQPPPPRVPGGGNPPPLERWWDWEGHETRVTNFRGFLGDTNRQGIGVTQPKFPVWGLVSLYLDHPRTCTWLINHGLVFVP